MKTITYNPETHVLVPREPTRDMVIAGTHQRFRDSYDAEEDCYRAMIAAAPQPEPVDVEPAMWVMKHIRSGDLTQAKPNQKALHPYMWSDAFPRYTTPQPDRTAELEAETTKLKLDLLTSYGEAEELSGKVAELEDQIAVLQEQIDLQIPAGVMIAQMKRIAELEAALKMAREALANCAADYLHADSVLTDSALAKINEVLHD